MQQSEPTEEKAFNYFRIPKFGQSTSDVTFIGLVDSSGSMSSYWAMQAVQYNKIIETQTKVFTITFSDSAHMKDTPILSNNINDHFCGGTNIASAFIKLNDILEKGQITTDNVTVIFISDGCDSSSGLEQRLKVIEQTVHQSGSYKKIINFICVAVGKGFPTFMAMKLREIYHNGESSIPSLFLIDTSIEGKKDIIFEEQFQMISLVLGHNKKVRIEPPCYKFPWQKEMIDECYSNSWVLSASETIECLLGNDKVQVNCVKEQTFETLIEIAKQWLQNIQLLSLKQAASVESKIAIEYLSKEKEKIPGKKEKKKLTFAERLKLRNCVDPEQVLQLLIKELKKYADFELLSKLTEEEAAKRLAIGTVVGKYHNVALKYKGISVDDYAQARGRFIELLEKKTVNFQKSSQEPSVISMQTQKDVFAEDDFVEGLKICPNQYELVETLPLIGHAVNVKRFDGSMINPWLIEVMGIARSHKIIDSLAIQQAGNSLTLSIGDNEKEEINCVLPLFDGDDQDMGQVLSSKLFHILMTFNVIRNVDTCFESAHAAVKK